MIIQFRPNVPEILQLSDSIGDLEGSQVFYPTSDGRTLALPEHAARKLAALSIQPGEEISIARYQKNGEPGSWVICLTPRSEKARADAEIAAQELRTRQLAQETRENPGRQLEDAAKFILASAYEAGARWIEKDIPDLIAGDGQYRNSVYRRAAAKLHPDAPGGSHELFVRLQAALRLLEGEG